ncbi:DUF2069 domain-containing protein [Halomonas sp. JS92-SW72]|uniref:DUF2069 domain-containing protein n=1 Tax=Halomonas sp. JS92-SW72 TaxID=2306583 RepID=UPI000E5B2DD8|nr:DUF2069 domain-containing protein [Halomonas sp. JS92-SW72]AXY41515.1 DUF2069 domain-containing protein [Halomonas sp. JS92-SW72]
MRRWLEALEAEKGLDHLTDRSRRWVLGSYGVLVVALLVWGLLLARDDGNLRPLLAFLLPLVLFLPSLLAKRPRGHAWLAFVSLLYFMIGVNVAILPGLGWLGWLIALAALALFGGCTFYARFRSRQQRAARGN